MTSRDPGDLPVIPELADTYQLVRELGRGGSAVVYLARERELGRDVAIKLIRPAPGADEEAVARLVREARTVGKLQHPNIVMLLGTRRLADGGLALILQFVPGTTLKEHIRERGPLPASEVESILRDLARALAYAHRDRIVHRDVKPENVYLDEEAGIARLADFGIARPWDSDSGLTLPGTAIGTPAYMSPEQVEGGRLDGRSDLYSLGLVAWEMLAGRQPWAGESLYEIIYKQKNEQLPALEEVRPDVPEPLRRAVERALRKDPDERWPTAAAFLEALSAPAPEAEPPAIEDPPAPDDEIPIVHITTSGTVPDDPEADPGALAATSAHPPSPEPSGTPASGAETGAAERPGKREPGAGTGVALLFGLVLIGAVGAAAVTGVSQDRMRSLLGQILPAEQESEAPRPPPPGVALPDEAPDGPPATQGGGRDTDPSAGSPATADPSPEANAEEEEGSADAGDVEEPDGEEEPVVEGPEETEPPPPDEPEPDVAPADPDPVPEPGAVRLAGRAEVVTGATHTCRLDTDGSLSCWGGNRWGQLGDGGNGRRMEPGPNVAGGAFARVESGLDHVCALDAGGRAYCWGANGQGQLGDGTTAPKSEPTPVLDAPAMIELAVGASHTCSATQGGEVYCWGANDEGQLGDGTTEDRHRPVRVQADVRLRAVAAGWEHTCALDDRGRAYCWGSNAAGELGGSTQDRFTASIPISGTVTFTALSAGHEHTCGLGQDGRVYCWGSNANGQLGDGTSQSRRVPTPVESERSFVSLAAGAVHTCALDSSGAAHCWGRNLFGQLGDGTTTDRNRPSEVSGSAAFERLHAVGSHTCGRTTTGETHCWGYNAEGQLGDGTRENRSVPARTSR